MTEGGKAIGLRMSDNGFYIHGEPHREVLNPRLENAAADGDTGRYQMYLYLGADPLHDGGKPLIAAAKGDHAEVVSAILFLAPNDHYLQCGNPHIRTVRAVDHLPDAAELTLQTAARGRKGNQSSTVVTAVLDHLSATKGHLVHIRAYVEGLEKKYGSLRVADSGDFLRNVEHSLERAKLHEFRAYQLRGQFLRSGMTADLAETYGRILDTKNPALETPFLDHADVIYGKAFDRVFAGRNDLQQKFSLWVREAVGGSRAAHDRRTEYVSALDQHAPAVAKPAIRRTLASLDFVLDDFSSAKTVKPTGPTARPS